MQRHIRGDNPLSPLNFEMRYKYSLVEDIKSVFWTLKSWRELKRDDVYIIKPSLRRWLWLLRNLPDPKVDFEDLNIICYWVSCGVWGRYSHDHQAIYICPWEMACVNETVESLIIHEVAHLKHPEAEDFPTYQEKEEYIEEKEKYIGDLVNKETANS